MRIALEPVEDISAGGRVEQGQVYPEIERACADRPIEHPHHKQEHPHGQQRRKVGQARMAADQLDLAWGHVSGCQKAHETHRRIGKIKRIAHEPANSLEHGGHHPGMGFTATDEGQHQHRQEQCEEPHSVEGWRVAKLDD